MLKSKSKKGRPGCNLTADSDLHRDIRPENIASVVAAGLKGRKEVG